MSLKKRIGDRIEARDVILAGEVTPTHLELATLKSHRLANKTTKERNRLRRARKERKHG